MTVQHIVLFSFPRELAADEAAQMRGMVASWPTEIGLMTKVRFGTDLTRARTRGYEYLLYTEFPDVDALNAYRAHPAHVTFLNWLNERDCTPLAFDYHLDDQTVLMPELLPAQLPRPPDGLAASRPGWPE
jgi:Stress responsive A/B Barrel Domain